MTEQLKKEIIKSLEGIEDIYTLNFINKYVKRILELTIKAAK